MMDGQMATAIALPGLNDLGSDHYFSFDRSFSIPIFLQESAGAAQTVI